MKIRLVQAQIVDKNHPLNGKRTDLYIEKGQIAQIAQNIDKKADRVIDAEGLCVSPGWIDMRANFRDPGEEQKETLDTGLSAAIRGGFTAVAIMPNTQPPIDSKGGVEYLLSRSKRYPIEVIPIGCLSKGLKGESLAEMYDMHQAGAAAFSDDKQSVTESGLLQRALLYARQMDAPILHFPYDESLARHGQMHEGIVSTQLGLKGIPEIAEEIIVMRDLALLAYTGGRLHLGPLSTAKSLELVHDARKNGMTVSAEVAMANLIYSDNALEGFDSNYKVLPPLRSESHQKELIKALKNGWIEVISSDHNPEDEEHKKLEFDLANFGLAGIEHFFPLLWSRLHKTVPIDTLVACFSRNPRNVLGLQQPELEAGKPANLTIFSTEENTVWSKGVSKAYNLPRFEKPLKGKVLARVCGRE